MTLLPQKIPPTKSGPTVQIVVEALAARLAAGDYPDNSRLPSERQLASDLGVARNTLREALDILESRGMIMRRAGAGSFVAQPGSWDETAPAVAATGPLHLHVMRGILEPEMIRLAILNMAPAKVETLSHILTRLDSVTDPVQFARHEEEFYLRVAEGTGNPLLVASYNLITKARQQRYRNAILRRHMTAGKLQSLRETYAALAEAIASRDISQATELVQDILIEEQRLFMQED